MGPGLVGLREHTEKIRRRADILNDTTLSESEKLTKIRAIFPDTTAEQLKALLTEVQEAKEEERY